MRKIAIVNLRYNIKINDKTGEMKSPVFMLKLVNICKKLLTKNMRIFDTNFERLQKENGVPSGTGRCVLYCMYFAKNRRWIYFPNSSLDVYQNPKSRREEIYVSYPTYDKYVSREFYSREKAMKDREVTSTRCPLCHNPVKRKIRWFMNNSKVYYSVSLCQEHGYVSGKIRIRRTEDNMLYYVIKMLTNITSEEADEIRQKRDAHRAKKRIKKEEK